MKYFYGGIIGLAIMGTSIALVAESHPVKKQPKIEKVEKIEQIFVEYGSPVPKQMTKAVNATKRPALMAAIALQESDGTPWARGKSGEKGAFQVMEKDWKIKVSDNPTEQALQAQKILDKLLKAFKGDVRKALSMYNGGPRPSKKSYKYADSVIAKWKKLKG